MTGPNMQNPTGTRISTGRRPSHTSQQGTMNASGGLKNSIVVGVPKEIKNLENRVGLTPSAALEYIKNGHTVIVETKAGQGSGFTDDMYTQVGSVIVQTPSDVYGSAQMIVKVKEPMPSEYHLIREGQIIFTYFHFAASRELTEAMVKAKAVCIAYETVECADRTLPLLMPMSEIAGRMSIQAGAKLLEKPMGGCGVLLAGVPGVRPGRVVVLGGGVVGTNAAKLAAGAGADVIVMDINVNRLRYLDDILPKNCRTLYCSTDNVLEELTKADLVIGAVLIPGAKCPKLVRRENLSLMKKGAVIIDVAVDQGGCIETCQPTTNENPTFVVDGVLHYCVTNMPGAVPNSSTIALNNVTMKYGIQLANLGWVEACRANSELKKGLNVVHGQVVYKGVADAFDMPLHHVDAVLEKGQMQNITPVMTKEQMLGGGIRNNIRVTA